MSSAVHMAASAIATYLAQYPGSADTAEGIHAWWLGHACPLEIVQRALELLEMEGTVERLRVGSRFVWRLAQRV
jgi:hypothetical protein